MSNSEGAEAHVCYSELPWMPEDKTESKAWKLEDASFNFSEL